MDYIKNAPRKYKNTPKNSSMPQRISPPKITKKNLKKSKITTPKPKFMF